MLIARADDPLCPLIYVSKHFKKRTRLGCSVTAGRRVFSAALLAQALLTHVSLGCWLRRRQLLLFVCVQWGISSGDETFSHATKCFVAIGRPVGVALCREQEISSLPTLRCKLFKKF